MNPHDQATLLLQTMKLQHAMENIDHFVVVVVPKTGNLAARFDVMTPEIMETRKWYRKDPHRHIGTYHIHDVNVKDLEWDIETYYQEYGGWK